METLGKLIEVANQVTWPGAVAISVCAISIAYVVGTFIKGVYGGD